MEILKEKNIEKEKEILKDIEEVNKMNILISNLV